MEFDAGVVHWPCPDGEAAKILLRDRFGARFPVKHYTHGVSVVDGAWAAQFRGQRLICVDWCPPTLDSVRLLAGEVKQLLIIDHHKSALPIAAEAKSLPENVRLIINSPSPAASTQLYNFLSGSEPKSDDGEGVPGWLRVVGLHDTGQDAKMTPDERAMHAALTDELTGMDEQRQKPIEELIKRGKHLIEKHRPMVAAALVAKAEVHPVNIKGTTYRVAYIDVPKEKFIHETNSTFWKTSTVSSDVDMLALRFPLSQNRTDFKLRRPPLSQLDLANLAALYSGGGHAAAAGIQLQNAPKFIPDLQ